MSTATVPPSASDLGESPKRVKPVSLTVDEQVRHLCGLLKEYADKLVELKRREWVFAVPQFGADQRLYDPLAWWLDECHRLRKPLQSVVKLASQTLEHLDLDLFQRDELTLRLAEVEVHLHHVLRRYAYWYDRVATDKRLKELITPLRMAHGLPLIK